MPDSGAVDDRRSLGAGAVAAGRDGIRGNALDPLTGPRKGRSARGGNDLAVSSGRGPEEESTLGGERAGGGHSQVQQSERGKAMSLDLGRLLEQSEDFSRAGNWDANALDCNLQIVKWCAIRDRAIRDGTILDGAIRDGAIRDAWKYRLRLGKCRSRSREPGAWLRAELDLMYVRRTAPPDSLERADAERELKAGSFQAARNAASLPAAPNAQCEDFFRADYRGSMAAACWRCQYGEFERESVCADCGWGFCPSCHACSRECRLVPER